MITITVVNVSDKTDKVNMTCDRNFTTMQDIMTRVCMYKDIKQDGHKLIFNGKRCHLYRTVRDYAGTAADINLFMGVSVRGGGKRGLSTSKKGGQIEGVESKQDYIAKSARTIRASIMSITADPTVGDNPVLVGIITKVETFVKAIDHDLNFFNATIGSMNVESLMEIVQVVGGKNFDHVVRQLCKVIWRQELHNIDTHIEHLQAFKMTILRDATSLGYCAANMSPIGVCDHGSFAMMITKLINERGFADGHAAARREVNQQG